MATTRTITGTVLKPDGTVYTDWAVKFSLLNEIISDGAVIPKHTVDITTDSNGAFTTALTVPTSGTASYNLRFQSGYSYDFYLASGSSIGLNEIISIATVASDPNYITELTSLTITYTDADLELTSAHEYVWSDGTLTITLPATTGSDTINDTTPVVIPADTVVWYADVEVGNWHSNW